MTNDELIQALKEDAEWASANEWETPITLGDHLDAAADLIESLQAQLAAEKITSQSLRNAANGYKAQLADARNELCHAGGGNP